jgi:hypothetical protein
MINWLMTYLSKPRRIFILEDSQHRISWFTNHLFAGHHLCIYKDVDEAIEKVRADENWDLIMLDHDLKPEHYPESLEVLDDDVRYQMWQDGNWRRSDTGYHFAEFLSKLGWVKSVPVIIHSMNSGGAPQMNRVLPHAKQWNYGMMHDEICATYPRMNHD